VALSGGRDSVALLHLLREPALDLRLTAAHVHHGLRSAEADADAEFCRRLCSDLGTPIAVLPLPDDDRRPATGEASWRRRRYRALRKHAALCGAEAVATAHHRDDVAEGVLVQVLRGAGPRAIAGILQRTDDGVVRPLLPWNRDQITGWLEERGIPWREDSSNADTSRLRAFVRHRVLPELTPEVPELAEHLVHLAGAIAEGEAYMASELTGRVGFADPWHPEGGVDITALRELPAALRSRWLFGQAARLGLGSATRRQIELFAAMLDEGSPGSVTLGGRWRLRAARGRVWAEPPAPPSGTEAKLTEGPAIDLGVPGWWARLALRGKTHPDAVWRWSPPESRRTVSVRTARTGDRLPKVRGGSIGARRLLAERLPRHLRRAWPVFCENDMIHWIPGVWQHPEHEDPNNRIVEVIRR